MAISAAFAFSLAAIAFSVAGQSPSSAWVSSSLGVGGQFGRSQEGPETVFSTLSASSPSESKKSRQLGSTELGSFS